LVKKQVIIKTVNLHFERRNKERNNGLENLEILCIRCHLEKHLEIGELYKGGFYAIQK